MKTIIAISDEHWRTLSETLNADANSPAFDQDLRQEIREALEGAAVITEEAKGLITDYTHAGFGVGDRVKTFSRLCAFEEGDRGD